MRSLRNALIGFAAFVTAVAAMPASAQLPPVLDGLWQSVNTPDAASIANGAKGFDENVLIENSLATREIFSQYGFLPTPSTVLSTSPLIKYECIYVADKFGTLKVEGTVDPLNLNKVTGKMTWTHTDGKVWTYTFLMVKIGAGPTPPTP